MRLAIFLTPSYSLTNPRLNITYVYEYILTTNETIINVFFVIDIVCAVLCVCCVYRDHIEGKKKLNSVAGCCVDTLFCYKKEMNIIFFFCFSFQSFFSLFFIFFNFQLMSFILFYCCDAAIYYVVSSCFSLRLSLFISLLLFHTFKWNKETRWWSEYKAYMYACTIFVVVFQQYNNNHFVGRIKGSIRSKTILALYVPHINERTYITITFLAKIIKSNYRSNNFLFLFFLHDLYSKLHMWRKNINDQLIDQLCNYTYTNTANESTLSIFKWIIINWFKKYQLSLNPIVLLLLPLMP